LSVVALSLVKMRSVGNKPKHDDAVHSARPRSTAVNQLVHLSDWYERYSQPATCCARHCGNISQHRSAFRRSSAILSPPATVGLLDPVQSRMKYATLLCGMVSHMIHTTYTHNLYSIRPIYTVVKLLCILDNSLTTRTGM